MLWSGHYIDGIDSAEWWQSMAGAIIFDLLISTLLTLGGVPTLCLIYSRLKGWFSLTTKWQVYPEMDVLEIAAEP